MGIEMGVHDKYQVVTVIIFAGGINKLNKSGKTFTGNFSTTES